MVSEDQLGRPTVLTEEITEALYNLIKAGNYSSVACRALGLYPGVYSNWLRQGEGRDRRQPATPETVAFAIRMRQAEAEAEVAAVKVVVEGSIKDPTLGLKFLGRRFRNRWGEFEVHKVDWTIRAINMLKAGDVTMDDLVKTFDKPALEEIKARMLESGEEAEWVEIEKKENAEKNAD